jgi:uncharacterized membrane protein
LALAVERRETVAVRRRRFLRVGSAVMVAFVFLLVLVLVERVRRSPSLGC